MKLLRISNTKIKACPLILGVVLFLSMTPVMHSEITNFKYVISDHLGTAKMLIDEEGNVIWLIIGTVESNELLPFGGELDVFQSEGRYNLNFTNKELDRVLDLHYFGARYYQSGIGRFLSPDPIGGNPADPLSWNKYLYCRNNPIMFIDPTGMAMTAPKPDDSNGFEFVGPPEPPKEQVEFPLADQIEQKIQDARATDLSEQDLNNLNTAKTIVQNEGTSKQVQKMRHIFDNPKHKLDLLVKELGSKEIAFNSLVEATNRAVIEHGLTNKFEAIVKVGSQDVTVRGNVIDNVTEIGTAFIK